MVGWGGNEERTGKQGNGKTLDVTKPLGKQQLRMQHVETEGENYEKTTEGVPTMVKISTGAVQKAHPRREQRYED